MACNEGHGENKTVKNVKKHSNFIREGTGDMQLHYYNADGKGSEGRRSLEAGSEPPVVLCGPWQMFSDADSCCYP